MKDKLDDFCRKPAVASNQPKGFSRLTQWTTKGVKVALGIKGDYFIALLELIESRDDNEMPYYQQALHIVLDKDRLKIKELSEQNRCDFLIGFFKTINKRRANVSKN